MPRVREKMWQNQQYRKLFLRGLPSDCAAHKIKDYFENLLPMIVDSGEAVHVDSVHVPVGRTFGFVTLTDHDKTIRRLLSMNLMYFDDGGTSHTLEIRPYVQAKNLQRKERQNYQDLRQGQILSGNRSKRASEAKLAEKPVVYKSPEHVRTEPDYSMAMKPCLKKKKRKRKDVDDCFSMFVLGNTKRNRPKQKREKIQKKRKAKLVFQVAESLDFVPEWGDKKTDTPDCEDKLKVDFVQSSKGKETQEHIRSVGQRKEEKKESAGSSGSKSMENAQVVIEHSYIGPVCFQVDKTCLMKDIKEELYTRSGLPIEHQALFCDLRKVADNDVVSDFLKAESGNTVTLWLQEGSLKGGAPPEKSPSDVKAPDERNLMEGRKKQMEEWNTDQICDWLLKIGLAEKYVQLCREEEINGESLLMLCSSDEELKTSLGLKLGPFTILKRKIKPHYERYCKGGASPCTSASSKSECPPASSVSVEECVSNYKPVKDTSEENIWKTLHQYEPANSDSVKDDSKLMDDNKKEELNPVLAESEDINQSTIEISTVLVDSENINVLPIIDPPTQPQQPSDKETRGHDGGKISEIGFRMDSSSGKHQETSSKCFALNKPDNLANEAQSSNAENRARLDIACSSISLDHDNTVDVQGEQRIEVVPVGPNASFHDAVNPIATTPPPAISTDNEVGVCQVTTTTVYEKKHVLQSDACNISMRPAEKYASILTSKLNINFKAVSHISKDSSTDVILKVGFVEKKKQMDFDRVFTFLIMTRAEANINIRKLWNTISKQSSIWSLLLDNDECRFGGENILATGWVNQVALANVPLEKLNKSCLVLIVDKTLIAKDTTEYSFCLDTKGTQYISTKIQLGDPYHAVFETRGKSMKVSLEVNMNLPRFNSSIDTGDNTPLKNGTGNSKPSPIQTATAATTATTTTTETTTYSNSVGDKFDDDQLSLCIEAKSFAQGDTENPCSLDGKPMETKIVKSESSEVPADLHNKKYSRRYLSTKKPVEEVCSTSIDNTCMSANNAIVTLPESSKHVSSDPTQNTSKADSKSLLILDTNYSRQNQIENGNYHSSQACNLSLPKNNDSPKSTSTSTYVTVLSQRLGIELQEYHDSMRTSTVSSSKDFEEVTASIIFAKRGKSANELEKAFNFMLLVKGDKKLSNEKSRVLWNQVSQHRNEWLQLLDKEGKTKFDVDESGHILSIKKNNFVSLRTDGPVSQIMLNKLTPEELNKSCIVLIVDENLIRQKANYFFSLDKEKNNNIYFSTDSSIPHHAILRKRGDDEELKMELTLYPSKDYPTPQAELSKEYTDVNLLMADSATAAKNNDSYLKNDKQRIHNESTPKNLDVNQTSNKIPEMIVHFDTPREFDTDDGDKTYIKGYIFKCLETGTKDLLRPVHEFKLLTKAFENSLSEEAYMRKFLYETLRFACACLNERTNGTIHFGVADQVSKQAQGYKSREIVGVPVSIELFSRFDEKLTEYIKKCFNDHSIARTCIRPTSFIPVRTVQEEQISSGELYVIEVDVVPSYSLCKKECFCVKLPLLEDVTRLEKSEKYFVRDGASSRPLDSTELQDFIAKKMTKVDEERERREQELSKTAPTNEDSRYLYRKLQRLLCAGKKTLDSSHYPILVVGKPDESMTQSYLESNFQFITNVNWQVIVDFDNQGSKSHNLCKIFTEKGRNCDIHEAEDFDGDEDLVNGILGNKFWIFGNGYDGLGKPLVDFKQWRNSKRKRGITQIIHFLSKTLPQTRTTVLFLILSKACEEMADTFAEFCTYFDGPNQLLYIVENKDIASSWKAELCRTCLTETEIVERGVVGMSWNELHQCIDQMVHGTDPEEMYLMMSSGSQYPLKGNHFNSLTVLSTRKCDDIQSYEREKFQALCDSEESKFYNGSPVSWENFWFTDAGYNHVLKRDDYTDLLEKVCKALKQDLTNERVKTVTLYHHNGAGASTMGSQILWDLRNSENVPCRCTVVSRIDDNTARELIHLRRIGYGSKDPRCPPVLAFVEDIDDFVFKEFKFRVAEKASNLPKSDKPVCVFLYCKAVQNPITCSCTELETSGHLIQKLTENEKKWFERKYKDMEIKFNCFARISMFEKYASENLISFMIMKENFNPNYARNLVKRNLENVSGSEYKLLTYMSLLNVFDPYPVFAACFDTIMLSQGFIKKKMFRDWIYDLSSSASVFLREKDCSEQFGTGKAIVIVHPIIASELLDQIASAEGKSVGDITLEFLQCGLFEHHSSYNYTVKHLRSTTNIMLKHRKKFDYGDDKQTKFSPLIEKILYPSEAATMEAIKKAVTVLEAGLEKFSDPMLAQQIARVYYLNAESFGDAKVEPYFQKAIKFAQTAINMSPNNSYLLDTMGRIFEKKLKLKYNPVKQGVRQGITLLEVHEAVPVLDLACETSQWFQKSQTASIDNPYEENKCGYIGEISNMFTLLDIFRSVRLFREINGAETLKKYLTEINFIPLPILKLWENYHVFVKGLEKRYLECMEELAEEYSIFKEDLMLSTNVSDRKRIAWFKVQYRSYFGREIELDSENTFPEDRVLYRQQEINKCLAGDLFYGVFNIVNMPRKGNAVVDKPRETLQRLKKLSEENLAEPHYKCDHRDLLGMITTSMALHSPYGIPDRSVLQRRNTASVCNEYKDTYKLIERLCAIESTRKRGRLYSYLLKVMFLWPRENIELGPNYIPQDFYDAMKKLSAEYNSKKKIKADTEKSIKQDMYKAMTFRNKNRQYTNLFYLGTGNGMDVFVHLNELPLVSTGRGGSTVDWDHPRVRQRLKRLTGTIESRNIIKMRNPRDPEQTVDIYYTGSHHGNFSKEEVSFYLGFSWSRPIALDLRYSKDVRREVVTFSYSPILGVLPDTKSTKFTVMPFEQYLYETRKLQRKLDEILQLKKKKEKGTTLEANQEEKLKRESELIGELEQLERNYAAFEDIDD